MTKIHIPFRKQENDYYCGPAVVQMILAGNGLEIAQQEIASAMKTDKHGTPIKEIERFLKTQGFETKRTNNASWEDIEDSLGEGETIIVGYLEPEEEKAHYAIIASMTEHQLFLLDPWHGAEQSLSRDDFEHRWRDDEDGAYGNRMMLAVRRAA